MNTQTIPKIVERKKGEIALETIVRDGKIAVEYRHNGKINMILPTNRPLIFMGNLLSDMEDAICSILNVKIIITTDE